MKMNDRSIKALKTTGKRYEDWVDGHKGLGVRVGAGGVKTWVFLYRHNGTQRRMTLGRYPKTGVARANALHAEALGKADLGQDPAGEAIEGRHQEQQIAATMAIEDVYEEFATHHLAGLRTGDEMQRQFKAEILPQWKGRRVDEISRAEVRALIREKAMVAPISANRLLALVRKFFNWCIEEIDLEHSPADHVKPPTNERERQRARVLSQSEIRAIWKAADEMGHSFGTIIKMLFLTGCRRGEIAKLEWSEVVFDDEEIRIPADKYKTKMPHVVPMSPPVKEILSELHARDRERAGKYPMPKYAIRSSRNHDKPVSGWSKSKRQIDLLAAKVRTTDDGVDPATMTDDEILEKYGIKGWKLHDIRRSLATHIRKEGASREATKWILGHVDGSVTAIYDRASHLPEVKRLLTSWADRIEIIVEGGAEVVPLRPVEASE